MILTPNKNYPIRSELKKMKRRVKKRKATDLNKLKKVLWSLTSIAVRLRDADSEGMCKCATCEYKGFYFKDKMQAGHFVKKSQGGVTEYMLENCNVQCMGCNLRDEQFLMGLYINKKYDPVDGIPYAEYLYMINKTVHIKKDRLFFEEEIKKVKELVMKLSKEKNLWEWKESFPKSYLS